MTNLTATIFETIKNWPTSDMLDLMGVIRSEVERRDGVKGSANNTPLVVLKRQATQEKPRIL